MNKSTTLLWLFTVVSAGGAAYLSAYFKRKGENLATHEDIQKLVAQVEATTEATKAIEGRIGDEFWNKQRVWEMKRDVLFGVVRSVRELEEATSDLIELAKTSDGAEGKKWVAEDKWNAAVEIWEAARSKLLSNRAEAEVTCGARTIQSITNAQMRIAELFESLVIDGEKRYKPEEVLYRASLVSLYEAVRAELDLKVAT